MKTRARGYRRISERSLSSDWTIIAHIGKTKKGKIRLRSVGITRKGQDEKLVFENLPENDPRFVFEDDYGMRKATHEIVRKSGQFSRFYSSSVRIVYERV